MGIFRKKRSTDECLATLQKGLRELEEVKDENRKMMEKVDVDIDTTKRQFEATLANMETARESYEDETKRADRVLTKLREFLE